MLSFNEYGFNNQILKSIKDLKFNSPTPIQSKVIPQILSSNIDIIASAQTGTGKTAAFGLPIIQLTSNQSKKIECVILCPTRELCLQITKDLSTYSKYIKNYKVLPIYGGTKVDTQIKSLKQNPKIIVCTPGRLNDLIKRRRVDFSLVKYFVLDEADEMLSMGFKSEIDKVLSEVPLNRNIYLFSATLSEKVKKITKAYMKKPLVIATSSTNKAADTVKHIYYTSNKNKRYDIIRNIIDINKDIYTIVFCRTRRETKDISDNLIRDNYKAKVLNGDLSQSERDEVMDLFRKKYINILVATDVASRGIDVDNLSHIINYNLPDDPEVYVHRSGRTGRAGNEGISIVFISKRENHRIKEIEKLSKISFIKNQIPSESDVFKSQISIFSDKIVKAPVPSNKDKLIFEKIYYSLDVFTKEEIIGKIISLNIKSKKSREVALNRKKDSHNNKVDESKSKLSRIAINIGRSNRVTPETLIKLINKTTRARDIFIGKIDIKKKQTTFEVDANMKDIICSKIKNIRFGRTKIIVSDNPQNFSRSIINKKKFKKRRKKIKY
tara:strand:- start:5717 stop:7372 length:1656 start_codon:yes stop_codon:yes gene_type:complete